VYWDEKEQSMKFSTREDIEAPIGHVWAQITDFAGFERMAIERGATLTRTDTMGKPGLGSEWDASIMYRKKARKVEARVVEFDAPRMIRVDSRKDGVEAVVIATLTELSPRRTRMHLTTDLKPLNLTGRLLIQSLKLARATLDRRYEKRVAKFVRGMSVEYREAS